MADANSTAGAFTCARCGQTIYDKATYCAGQWYHPQCVATPPRLDRAKLDAMLKDYAYALCQEWRFGFAIYANATKQVRDRILDYCCPETTDA